MTRSHTLDTVSWSAAEPIAVDRVHSGAPEASTAVLHEDDRSQVGFWRVTAGEFTTRHQGYVEFITVLEGRGALVHEDGTRIELGPGTVTVLPDGWAGRWEVNEALTKSYAVVPTAAAS